VPWNTLLEATAVIFGVACVWLTVRQNIWCWPTGLVQVVLYIFIFYEAKLYSDVLLQVVYVGLQLYGWHHWLRGGRPDSPLVVTSAGVTGSATWIIVGLVGALGLGLGMSRYTDAALPYWDAAIASLSLVAQYLLARKVLQSWLFWIVVDVIAIGVYAAKALYLTTGLYLLFLGLATLGYFEWKRTLSAPVPAPA
jgi:nicotinamide mononucleotide transporter